MDDLTALVDRCKTDFGVGNGILSKPFSVLNECLLNDVDHIVTTTADSTKVNKNLAELIHSVVTMQTFVNKLLLDDFPKFIVLKESASCAFDSHQERTGSLSVKSCHLLLDHGDNDVPEVLALLKLVHADVVEAEHDLFGSHHFVAEFLVNVHDVRGVLRMDQSEVNLVEDH